MGVTFNSDTALGKALSEWWQSLSSHDKGGRAELRRCQDLTGVIVLPTFQRLYQRVRPLMSVVEGDWSNRLAMIAAVLAHVDPNGNESAKPIAARMSESKPGGSTPRLSELRFRRLIQRDRDEIWLALVRVMPMLDRKANIFELANAIFYWGDQQQRRWAYDYFAYLPEKGA